jgi:hypothetical protein
MLLSDGSGLSQVTVKRVTDWIAFVLLKQLFAMPVYWHFNIGRERREAT